MRHLLQSPVSLSPHQTPPFVKKLMSSMPGQLPVRTKNFDGPTSPVIDPSRAPTLEQLAGVAFEGEGAETPPRHRDAKNRRGGKAASAVAIAQAIEREHKRKTTTEKKKERKEKKQHEKHRSLEVLETTLLREDYDMMDNLPPEPEIKDDRKADAKPRSRSFDGVHVLMQGRGDVPTEKEEWQQLESELQHLEEVAPSKPRSRSHDGMQALMQHQGDTLMKLDELQELQSDLESLQHQPTASRSAQSRRRSRSLDGTQALMQRQRLITSIEQEELQQLQSELKQLERDLQQKLRQEQPLMRSHKTQSMSKYHHTLELNAETGGSQQRKEFKKTAMRRTTPSRRMVYQPLSLQKSQGQQQLPYGRSKSSDMVHELLNFSDVEPSLSTESNFRADCMSLSAVPALSGEKKTSRPRKRAEPSPSSRQEPTSHHQRHPEAALLVTPDGDGPLISSLNVSESKPSRKQNHSSEKQSHQPLQQKARQRRQRSNGKDIVETSFERAKSPAGYPVTKAVVPVHVDVPNESPPVPVRVDVPTTKAVPVHVDVSTTPHPRKAQCQKKGRQSKSSDMVETILQHGDYHVPTARKAPPSVPAPAQFDDDKVSRGKGESRSHPASDRSSPHLEKMSTDIDNDSGGDYDGSESKLLREQRRTYETQPRRASRQKVQHHRTRPRSNSGGTLRPILQRAKHPSLTAQVVAPSGPSPSDGHKSSGGKRRSEGHRQATDHFHPRKTKHHEETRPRSKSSDMLQTILQRADYPVPAGRDAASPWPAPDRCHPANDHAEKKGRVNGRCRRSSPHPVPGFADPSLAKQTHQQAKESNEKQTKKMSKKHASHRTTSKSIENESSRPKHGEQMNSNGSSSADSSPESPLPSECSTVSTQEPSSPDSIPKSSRLASRTCNDDDNGQGDAFDDVLSVSLKRTSQNSHTAEELRHLIELMRAEFRKLRSAKANAEARAQTLETDLVAMEEERDAEYTRLRTETERWKRALREEEARHDRETERMRDALERLEGENEAVKVRCGEAARDRDALEEKAASLENERARLSGLLSKRESRGTPETSKGENPHAKLQYREAARDKKELAEKVGLLERESGKPRRSLAKREPRPWPRDDHLNLEERRSRDGSVPSFLSATIVMTEATTATKTAGGPTRRPRYRTPEPTTSCGASTPPSSRKHPPHNDHARSADVHARRPDRTGDGGRRSSRGGAPSFECAPRAPASWHGGKKKSRLRSCFRRAPGDDGIALPPPPPPLVTGGGAVPHRPRGFPIGTFGDSSRSTMPREEEERTFFRSTSSSRSLDGMVALMEDLFMDDFSEGEEKDNDGRRGIRANMDDSTRSGPL